MGGNLQLMEHINLVYGLLVYSFALVNLFLLFLLWKRNNQETTLWTFLLIASFTLLMLSQLIYSYLAQMDLNRPAGRAIYLILGYIIDLTALSLVYTIPRFSISMLKLSNRYRKQFKLLALFCVTLGIFYLLIQLFGSERRNISVMFIYIALSLTILLTLIPIVFFKFRKEIAERGVTWEQELSTSMAKCGLLFLPLFILFDFFPHLWQGDGFWVQLTEHFSAVPMFSLIWNIGLFKEIYKQNLLRLAITQDNNVRERLQDKGLSPRELEVALLLVEGCSYVEIEEKLFLSKATVKSHTNKIYKKTGTSNQVSLIKSVS